MLLVPSLFIYETIGSEATETLYRNLKHLLILVVLYSGTQQMINFQLAVFYHQQCKSHICIEITLNFV